MSSVPAEPCPGAGVSVLTAGPGLPGREPETWHSGQPPVGTSGLNKVSGILSVISFISDLPLVNIRSGNGASVGLFLLEPVAFC